ncbi:MBOAT, membrane-bound O-acyltransferase family-domain-containing protein [Thermoascus aurantiacus ATCC 26904]
MDPGWDVGYRRNFRFLITAGQYLLIAGDAELQNTLRQRIEREEFGNIKKQRFKFRDLNEILRLMFHKDVLVLGLTDGVLCGSTIFCLLLQRAIEKGYLSWNRSGWIIQNAWQTFYLGAVIWWTYHRDWPWTHTHSYAFYNGHYLDTESSATQSSLQLTTPRFGSHDLNSLHRCRYSSAAPLDLEQIRGFQRLIKWEIDLLTEELKGQCLVTANHYPNNLNVGDFYGFIPLPTLKTAATFGVIGVMIAVSQAWIYPVVMSAVQMKNEGLTLQQRLKEFPWCSYLLSFYVIWECVLNALAEITRFADRGFYGEWWNSVSWDQFARDWNRPVHNFLLRHVYHSSISAFNLSRSSATFVTFLLSACVHELIMLCIFRQLRGYLLMFQMLQLPLVSLSRTSLLRGRRTLGNVIFWLGIFTGPTLLCSLYLII